MNIEEKPAAVPQGWAMEAVEDGIRLTAPDGERWRFRETDGSDLFVFKFLRAMLNAAPAYADHFPDARKMAQASPPHCEAGPDFCPRCHAESKPTYGSEEVRKLRETIASQAKIIETMQKERQRPPPWWPAVENILEEFGLQAIFFVDDFNKAMAAAAAAAAEGSAEYPFAQRTR